MGEVINIADRLPPGNGSRESLIDALKKRPKGHETDATLADWILALLWYDGFKIVPLDGTEQK